jgi:Fic/DOC family N-terminal
VTLSDRTWALASEAMLSIGRLDQAGRQVPDPALLRRPTLRREAQSTSALEGTYGRVFVADDVLRVLER